MSGVSPPSPDPTGAAGSAEAVQPTWRSQLSDYSELTWSAEAKATKQLAGVPRGPGVFAMLTAEGGVAQFGGTDTLAARLRYYMSPPAGGKAASRQRADLRGVVRRILYRPTGGGFETRWECLRLTRLIHPTRYREELKLWPAVFVWADLSEAVAFPRLSRTETPLGLPPGAAVVGPLASRAAAGRYLELLAEGFELCGCRQSRASVDHLVCPTWQMGKCPLPADVAEHSAEYRRRVSDAMTPSRGGHDRRRSELEAAMHAAAGRLAFDQAARHKARLAKLTEARAGAWAELRGLTDCDWLVVVASAAPADWVGFAMRAGHFGRVLRFAQSQAEAALGELLAWLSGPESLAVATAAAAAEREDHLALLVGWRQWRENASVRRASPPSLELEAETGAETGADLGAETGAESSLGRARGPAQLGLLEALPALADRRASSRAELSADWAAGLKKIYLKSKKISD